MVAERLHFDINAERCLFKTTGAAEAALKKGGKYIMAFCGKCGAQLADGAKFCPACGAPVAEAQPAGSVASNFGAAVSNINNTEDTTANYNVADINDNKGISVLSYIGILFLIPLLAKKDSPYAQYHAKQGFNLFLLDVAIGIVNLILGFFKVPKTVYGFVYDYETPLFVSIISWLLGLGVLALAIIGIVNAVQGKAKELPIIGKIKILK